VCGTVSEQGNSTTPLGCTLSTCTCDTLAGYYNPGTHLGCLPVCGDDRIVAGEHCETGYLGCNSSCLCTSGFFAASPATKPCNYTCGDGLLAPPAEQCEPSLFPVGSCTSQCGCNSAVGYYNLTQGSCLPVCGDAIVAPNSLEQCDSTPGCDNSSCLCVVGYVRNVASNICDLSCGVPPQEVVNASCANGILTYKLPTCEFFGSCQTNGTSGAGGAVGIRPRTEIQLIGNATISNATIQVQITSGARIGLVIASDCVNITGQIQVTLTDAGAISHGDKLPFLRLDRPECSIDDLNSTVIVSTQGETDSCRIVTATKQREQTSNGAQSLVVLFSVSNTCATPEMAVNSSLSPGLIGGITAIVVVVAGSVAVVVVVLLMRKAQKRKEKGEELEEMYRTNK
jgi:hypothetical protein